MQDVLKQPPSQYLFFYFGILSEKDKISKILDIHMAEMANIFKKITCLHIRLIL